MIVEKLIKSSIMDALNLVWSESGIIPSKKTRKTILKAAEKISTDVEEDFKKAKKKQLLNEVNWATGAQLKTQKKSVLAEVA